MSVPQEVDPTPYVQHDAPNAPPTLPFALPDGTKLVASEETAGTITIASSDGSPLGTFAQQQQDESRSSVVVSVPGLLNDDRVVREAPYVLSLPEEKELLPEDIWPLLYGFWLRRTTFERLPLALDERTIAKAKGIANYLVSTGLAYPAPSDDEDGSTDVVLVRASFWQGAGAPESQHWLRYRAAQQPFPRVLSFARGPNTCTVHPLRPPKPAPGTTLYTRYIASVGQTLSLVHIDAKNPVHFDTYSRWQNSERVNVGWRERGDEAHHRKYIASVLADKHTMGLLVLWDGELGGYGEMSWTKEDHVDSFLGGHSGDYDQGTHYLAGEEKFRGRHRFTAVMTSLKHCCFLRDARTDVVIGEPRYDLPIIPRLIAFLPQEFNREFEMPHKRAVYFVLRRERFFQAATLY